MYQKYKPEGSLIHTPENRNYTASLAGLERAMVNGTILEETALLCDSEMNLHFDLGGITGILPREECVYCRPGEIDKDIAVITRVGKPVCFRVIGIERESGTPVAHLSRRRVQRDCLREYLSTLIAGDIIRVKITHRKQLQGGVVLMFVELRKMFGAVLTWLMTLKRLITMR